MNDAPRKTETSDAHETCVACESVSLRYRSGFLARKRVRALEGVSFSLPRGTLTALVGANGSGKSSLLRSLLGYEADCEGQIQVLGHRPGHRALRGRVGAVLGARLPLAALRGREFLELSGVVQGLPRHLARARSAELLRAVQLDFAAERAHGSYSTGMARRLALAEALLRDPELLLLDEPGSGLDPVALAVLRELLVAQRDAGRSAVVATHVLDALGAEVFDRILVLDNGELVADGTPEEVLGAPQRRELCFDGLSPEGEARVLDTARDAGAQLRHKGTALARLSEALAARRSRSS